MRLVKSKFINLYWVEDEHGKRASEIFKVRKIIRQGPLIRVSIEDTLLFRRGPEELFIAPDRFIWATRININVINETYYSVEIPGKYIGTYDKNGICLGEDMYVFGYQEDVDMYSASYKNKYGFIDKNNNWVIKPNFLSIKTWFVLSKVAIVEIEEDKCVIIDIKGNHIGESFACYEVRRIITDVNQEKSVFLIGKERCVIDKYIEARKWGIIDFNGKTVIPTIYDAIEKTGDFYKLKLNGKYGLASLEGKLILECIYPEIIELEDKFVIPEICVREIPKIVSK